MTDLHDPAIQRRNAEDFQRRNAEDVRLAVAEHPTWQRICLLNDLEPGWGEAALVGERPIAVFRLGVEDVYAVQHTDPATGAHVIARGITGSRQVGTEARPTVAAPLHKQVYDLGTGACLSGVELRLETYPTRIVDGWLEVAA